MTKKISEGQNTLDVKEHNEVIITDKYMDEVFCPFCFLKGYLYQFLILRRNKEVGKRGECPECKRGMLLSTLMTDMTPYEYGTFVYNYCCMEHGYEKFSWNKLKERVRQAGISYDFWKGFNEAKEKRHTEHGTYDELYKSYVQSYKTG